MKLADYREKLSHNPVVSGTCRRTVLKFLKGTFWWVFLMANGKRQKINFSHIERTVEALKYR